MYLLKALMRDIIKDMNKFSLANLLTLARLIFLPFILYNLTFDTPTHDRIAAVLLCLAGISDFFDGYTARKFNQISQVGKILDPVVDKISVGTVMVFLSIYNELPSWYTAIVIGRDFFILCGSLYIMASRSFIVQSNILGKFTSGFFVAVILSFTLHLHPLTWVFMWISVSLIPASGIVYILNYIIKFKSSKSKFSHPSKVLEGNSSK